MSDHPLQPHIPGLIRAIDTEQAKEKAQRTAGVFEYVGPRWPWMGPAECVWCSHSVFAHDRGQCWTVDGVESNNSNCPCTTNLEDE